MANPGSGKLKIPLIGLLAVKNHLITKQDLQTALSICTSAPDLSKALKEYFLFKKLISSQNLDRLFRAEKALELRQKEFKFGAIAVRKGFINQSVLKLVLEEQQQQMKTKKQVRLIGDLLVDAGMLTEKQKDYVLKLQKRVREETARKRGKAKKEPPQNQAPKDAAPKDAAPGNKKQPETVKDDQGTRNVKAKGLENEKKGDENPEAEHSENHSKLLEAEVIAGGIQLEVAGDFMAAFLSKTDYFDSNITVTEIKEALFEKGIVLGIVKDTVIEGFIRSSGFKTKSFRVAKGVLPIKGKDARVEFFFNTDYLKAGGMTKDGSIDFKERGEIPHVEEGTVLAEKIPLVEARNGHNIYGDEIPTIPGSDIPFKFGKGAKLSEDGFKVLAAVKGFPKYALSGHIFVHDVYISEGDVDYETGHVQYDGNVDIKGRIKAGFHVSGNDIKAIELDGGTIKADGDVSIAGGINEGTIYAKGNVYAKFVHNSEVVCMGDVVVQKEIVDSNIECSGCCVIENGKLISSQVTSKMGTRAKNIGTQMAGPSTIKIGHDIFTEKELAKNKEKMDGLKKQIDHRLEKKEKLTLENLNLQKQITTLAHVQDRSQLEEKEARSKLAELENNGADLMAIEEIKQKMDQLRANAAKAEENLDKCFDETEKIEEILENEETSLNGLEKRMADFQDERNNLIQWSKDNPGNPVVIVDGAIMPETHIRGMHCDTRISELIRHARISEVVCRSEDGQSLNIYEMQIGNI
ncbi:MAG: FapA family protein [Desulfobacula sp.]|nr:FapA family protein [Desulfobacula sp.]